MCVCVCVCVQLSVFVSALFACALNYSSTVCTQYNSPLTTSVTGQVKNVVTTVLGMILFDVQPSRTLVVRASSVWFVLCGFVC